MQVDCSKENAKKGEEWLIQDVSQRDVTRDEQFVFGCVKEGPKQLVRLDRSHIIVMYRESKPAGSQ